MYFNAIGGNERTIALEKHRQLAIHIVLIHVHVTASQMHPNDRWIATCIGSYLHMQLWIKVAMQVHVHVATMNN